MQCSEHASDRHVFLRGTISGLVAFQIFSKTFQPCPWRYSFLSPVQFFGGFHAARSIQGLLARDHKNQATSAHERMN